MYRDFTKEGIRCTIISFEPFLRREDVRDLTDAQVGRKFGLATPTMKASARPSSAAWMPWRAKGGVSP